MNRRQNHRGREGAAAESRGEDLLSVLPDELLLKIRALLPADLVARTRLLGRRWARLPFLPTPPTSFLLPQAWRGGGARGGGVPVVDLEDEWRDVLAGVAKLKTIPDASDAVGFAPDEYMHLYTTIYNMCTQKGRNDYSQELYYLYKQALDEHMDCVVFPSLNEKHGEFLLREMVQRWEKHKLMVMWLRRFFDYLDRFYVTWKSLDSLKDLGWISFRDLVFDKLKSTVTTIVIGMIDDERDGKLIDRALLKNVLDMYVEIGESQLSTKARTWILENSYPEYMLKAEECLQKEKEQAVNHLHSTTEPKASLFELIDGRTEEILNKDNSRCKVLLCDEKTKDQQRMFRLGTTGGLLPVSKTFQQDASDKGMSLLKHATDAAKSRKDEKTMMPIYLLGGSKIVDEILGRAVGQREVCHTTLKSCSTSSDHPEAHEFIETSCRPHVGHVVPESKEDYLVFLYLDLVEELEEMDEIHQNIMKTKVQSSRSKSKVTHLWKLLEDRVQKCSAIKRKIAAAGGCSQEIPSYMIG